MIKILPKTITNTWNIRQVNQLVRWRMPSITSRGFIMTAYRTWPEDIEHISKLQTLTVYHAGMVLVGDGIYDSIDSLLCVLQTKGSSDLYGPLHRLVVILIIVLHSTIATIRMFSLITIHFPSVVRVVAIHIWALWSYLSQSVERKLLNFSAIFVEI